MLIKILLEIWLFLTKFYWQICVNIQNQEGLKMAVMERIGVNREKFRKIYEENNGFNSEFNRNAPVQEKSFLVFINSGAKKLNEEQEEFVKNIIIS